MSHFPDDIRSFMCSSGRKSATRLFNPHNDWYDFITELDGHVFPHDHKIPESKTAAMKVWTTTWDTEKGIGTMSYYRRGDQPIPYGKTVWAYHCWVGPFGHEVWENEKGNLEYTIFWPTDEPWVEWVKLEVQWTTCQAGDVGHLAKLDNLTPVIGSLRNSAASDRSHVASSEASANSGVSQRCWL